MLFCLQKWNYQQEIIAIFFFCLKKDFTQKFLEPKNLSNKTFLRAHVLLDKSHAQFRAIGKFIVYLLESKEWKPCSHIHGIVSAPNNFVTPFVFHVQNPKMCCSAHSVAKTIGEKFTSFVADLLVSRCRRSRSRNELVPILSTNQLINHLQVI